MTFDAEHLFICLLCALGGEMSIQIIWPFLNWASLLCIFYNHYLPSKLSISNHSHSQVANRNHFFPEIQRNGEITFPRYNELNVAITLLLMYSAFWCTEH